MKLNPEDLAVTSFDTSPAERTIGTDPIIINPNDPTANTWCYVCPVRTNDGCW